MLSCRLRKYNDAIPVYQSQLPPDFRKDNVHNTYKDLQRSSIEMILACNVKGVHET